MQIELGPEGEFEKKRLGRLVKLQQSDRGFFLLACHSYIESWLRQRLHMWEESNSFEDLIFRFKISLIENSKGFPKELSVLQNLRIKERTARAVKHSFVEISPEEAAAAAYRLIQFCSLAGINNNDELDLIRGGLKRWDDRQLTSDDELTLLSRRISEILKENKELLTEIEQLRRYRNEAENYVRQIAELETRIRSLKGQNYGGQADELVRQMAAAEESKQRNTEHLAGLKPAGEYISGLERLTGYTRTRFDFEREITKLTAEQQKALDSISLCDDFLIKGGAGTGKTLVLIKALEKAILNEENQLSFDEEQFTARMLTYNRTLAKYDRYLAGLLSQKNQSEISTIDKFLYDRLRLINEDYRIVFEDGYAEELVAGLVPPGFLTDRETADEIEGFIFSGALTESRYLDSGRGLSKSERLTLWNISRAVIKKMEEASAFTKNYSRIIIIEYLKANPGDTRLRDTDFAFIDEVQDLPAVDLMAVKACTKRAVIMAGDADQSIYQSGFSFSGAGINIRGKTRILRKNFRNTIEIQEKAEQYRLLSGSADPENQPEAFRTGPPPELYSAADLTGLTGKLVSKVKILTRDLGYDPENICILVPSSRDIEPMKKSLGESGYQSTDLREDGFSFNRQGVIRISTMHSSKGLDFPVVLLYLHRLPQTSAAADRAAEEKMRRNLIYVSMTRAMDQLGIFTLTDQTEPEITDLVRLLG